MKDASGMNQYHRDESDGGAAPASRFDLPPGQCESMLLNRGETLAESNISNMGFKCSISMLNMVKHPEIVMTKKGFTWV